MKVYESVGKCMKHKKMYGRDIFRLACKRLLMTSIIQDATENSRYFLVLGLWELFPILVDNAATDRRWKMRWKWKNS